MSLTPLIWVGTPDPVRRRLLETETPWTLPAEIPDLITQALAGTDPADWLRPAPDIHIHRSCRVHPSAVIEGPAYIGPGTELRPGAYLRGPVYVGRDCVVGHGTEIKRSILQDRAQAPHLNYVGDSVLGLGAHLGAGAILTNVRSDGRPIGLAGPDEPIDTGLRKFGSLLGDSTEIASGAILNPGTVIGADSRVHPLTNVSGTLPPGRILRPDGTHRALPGTAATLERFGDDPDRPAGLLIRVDSPRTLRVFTAFDDAPGAVHRAETHIRYRADDPLAYMAVTHTDATGTHRHTRSTDDPDTLAPGYGEARLLARVLETGRPLTYVQMTESDGTRRPVTLRPVPGRIERRIADTTDVTYTLAPHEPPAVIRTDWGGAFHSSPTRDPGLWDRLPPDLRAAADRFLDRLGLTRADLTDGGPTP